MCGLGRTTCWRCCFCQVSAPPVDLTPATDCCRPSRTCGPSCLPLFLDRRPPARSGSGWAPATGAAGCFCRSATPSISHHMNLMALSVCLSQEILLLSLYLQSPPPTRPGLGQGEWAMEEGPSVSPHLEFLPVRGLVKGRRDEAAIRAAFDRLDVLKEGRLSLRGLRMVAEQQLEGGREGARDRGTGTGGGQAARDGQTGPRVRGLPGLQAHILAAPSVWP